MDTSETSEWEFFTRIEELELTLPETTVVALSAFALAFYTLASTVPNPRRLKDSHLGSFRRLGLRKELLDKLDQWMVHECELVEEHRKLVEERRKRDLGNKI